MSGLVQDRLRQAGAERGVDHALLQEIAHRLVRVVLLDRERLEQRQHGRAAVRAAGVHRALHPMHLAQVDAVFVLQDAVDVDRRRHGEERHADALAFEVLRLGDAGLLVDGDEAVAEGARGKHRDGDERALLVGEALHELGAGIFRDVEFLAGRHAVEDRPRLVDGDEIEVDAVGLHFAGVERLHAVVESGRKRKLQLGHGRRYPPVGLAGKD